jgi:hypothetical protein
VSNELRWWNDGEFDTVERVGTVVAWFTEMAKGDDMAKGRDVMSIEKFAIPLLHPMEGLILVHLDEALGAGDGRLKTLKTMTCLSVAICTTIAGCPHSRVIVYSNNCIIDFIQVPSKLFEEDRRLQAL